MNSSMSTCSENNEVSNRSEHKSYSRTSFPLLRNVGYGCFAVNGCRYLRKKQEIQNKNPNGNDFNRIHDHKCTYLTNLNRKSRENIDVKSRPKTWKFEFVYQISIFFPFFPRLYVVQKSTDRLELFLSKAHE